MPKHIKDNIAKIYSQQPLSVEELHKLEKWLESSDSDDLGNQWLGEMWNEARDTDVEISFESIKKEINQRISPPVRRIRKLGHVFQRVAAILLLPLLLIVAWLAYHQSSEETQWVEVRTGKGEQAGFCLPDGSEVRMNALSTLAYNLDYNEDNRDLKVMGEVFIKVHKNKELPLVVKTGNLAVEALGTEFYVKNYEDEEVIEALLVEGRVGVDIANPGELVERTILNPGQGVYYNKVLHQADVRNFNTDMALAWSEGRLVFNDDEFGQVVKKIERWYGITVRYNPEDFKGESFSVNLKKEETLYNLLEILTEAIGFNYRMIEDTVIITKE